MTGSVAELGIFLLAIAHRSASGNRTSTSKSGVCRADGGTLGPFLDEVIVDTCGLSFAGAPNGCSENDQPNSSLHRHYGAARAHPRAAIKAHARWCALACGSAAPLPWLGRDFWPRRDRCPGLDRSPSAHHLAYQRPRHLRSCSYLLRWHDRCLCCERIVASS